MQITVAIPTLSRTESLRITLKCLADADKSAIKVRVIVVDNSEGDSATRSVVEEFREALSTSYLTERQRGKSYCLNRALDTIEPGDVFAVLDDDMSPHPDWFQGVAAITQRWPGKGFYSGRSYVIWPPEVRIPAWVKHPALRGWAFSVCGPETGDQVVEPGRWVSGNHFWMRRGALGSRRFCFPDDIELRTHLEMSEPRLMLELTEAGLGGVMGSDAVAGHRVQTDLLSFEVLLQRAVRVGRGFAEVRLRPYRECSKQARMMRKHTSFGVLFSRAMCSWYCLQQQTMRFPWVAETKRALLLRAVERAAFYREVLRLAPETRARMRDHRA